MNEKIEYFISYWRDLTHPNNSIEVQFSHIILYNPKELFKEFADEIRIKKLSNKDNKKFFIKKVNQFSNLNLKALNCINPTLKLIKEQFSKKYYYKFNI